MRPISPRRRLTPILNLLRNRDFALLFSGFVLVQGTLPLQLVTQIFWLQEHTDPGARIVLVGLLATTRGLGMVGFGLYGGALADRFDRRRLLIGAQAAAVVMHVGILATLAISDGGNGGLAVFFALILGSSALWAVDGPTRQAMAPDILGPRAAVRGLALNAAGAWAITPLTVLAAGFIIDSAGFSGTYSLLVAFQVLALGTLLPLRYRRRAEPDGQQAIPGLRGVMDGLRYAARHPYLRWIILLMALMTVLGMPAVSGLGPTWVTLEVGATFSEFGMIAAVWGLAGLLVAMALTRFAHFERLGVVMALGAILFGVGFVIFAAKAEAAFAAGGNAALGAGLVAAQVSGTALIAHYAPNRVRARLMSLLLLDRAFAQLLALPLAAVGQVAGLTTVFPILATLTLSLIVLLVLPRGAIWRARIRTGLPPQLAET